MGERTWQQVREAVEFCGDQPNLEYSLHAPKAACDAAKPWMDFLEFIGAKPPQVLPSDDAMRLTWDKRPSLPKFYLTIQEDGTADILDSASLDRALQTPEPQNDK